MRPGRSENTCFLFAVMVCLSTFIWLSYRDSWGLGFWQDVRRLESSPRTDTSRCVPIVGIIGMYGPPQNCKRKSRWRFGLRQCIRPLVESATPGHDGFRPLSSLLASRSRRTSTDIRFRKRRFDRCAISVIRQQTWQEIIHSDLSSGGCDQDRNPIRLVLAQTPPRPCGAAYSPARQPPHSDAREPSAVQPVAQPRAACLSRYCITTRAPCTNSLRRYEFPRLLMPSSFCLPPVEYSRGTMPDPGGQVSSSSKAGCHCR